MFRPRLIPVLLLRGTALVKTRGFRDPTYVGDPVNAVRIFNDLKADELVFLDIDASREGRTIPLDFVRRVGEEAAMPFAVGGGIGSLQDVRAVLEAGAEKVILATRAAQDPSFVRDAAEAFGSSTIVVCMDVKSRFGRLRTWTHGGTRPTAHGPEDFARLMEAHGTGELIVQSMARDGSMGGYDLELTRRISRSVTIPVVALGGAGSLEDLRRGHREGHATGLAAGSFFIFQGKRRGVLLSYPRAEELAL